MSHDWPTIQDAQITGAIEALDRLADDPSAIRRLAVVTDGFIPNKHLVNAHVVKRRSEAFRILDVGCGTGELLARLLSAFPLADGIGLDPNPGSLERARARGVPRCRFLELPFDAAPPGPFDFVICSEVFEHVEQPEALLDVLRDRVAPGGYLSISTPSGWMFRTPRLYNLVKGLQNPARFIRVKLRPERHWAEALPSHPAILPSVLRDRLEARGFVVVLRQSALWWIQQPGVSETLFHWTRSPHAAARYYHWHRGLDAVMNIFPPLRYFESRAVWLMQRAS